jgi:hypothetical protein
MPTEEEGRDHVTVSVPVAVTWSEVIPCCANVWDNRIGAYHPCDELADPDSDLDLCAAHHARLTSILSLISAAQSTARESEEASPHQREPRSRPRLPGNPHVTGRDGRTART